MRQPNPAPKCIGEDKHLKARLLFVLAILTWSEPHVAYGAATENTAQEPKASPSVIQSNEGIIDGERYVAQIVSDKGAPDFLLLKAMGKENSQISRMELIGDLNAYHVRVAKNSVYFRWETSHHGIFSSTYQFRKIKQKFYLVGLETQAMTSCLYSVDTPDAEKEPCTSMEMWSGTSVNFVTSRAECWLQTFNLAHDERSKDWQGWKTALENFKLGIASGKAIRRGIKLPRSQLVALDQFDLYNVNEPRTCYFDYKGGFHTS